MYHLDQSIRIEQTNKDTIIGLANMANEKSYTLIISARIKRQIQEHYRRHGLPKRYMVDLFIAAVILTIKRSHFSISELAIDQEYPGYENLIITIIEKYSKGNIKVHVATIGKHSPAHLAAYGVYIHKRKANGQATFQSLMKILNKKDRGL